MRRKVPEEPFLNGIVWAPTHLTVLIERPMFRHLLYICIYLYTHAVKPFFPHILREIISYDHIGEFQTGGGLLYDLMP